MTSDYSVVASDNLVVTSHTLVATSDHLVVTASCVYLVLTRYELVMACHYLVGTRASVVVADTCPPGHRRHLKRRVDIWNSGKREPIVSLGVRRLGNRSFYISGQMSVENL